MFKKLKIGDLVLREGGPVLIIAEAGVNHNGRLDLALKLVDAAKKAGADIIKFQTFKAEDIALLDAKMAAYQKKNLKQNKSQREMLRELELNENFYKPIIKRCQNRKILFLSTAGSEQSVDFLESISVSAYKIGASDMTNYFLLDKVAKTKKPILLSTGMATLAEAKDAVSFIQSRGNDKIAIFHCTTNYPCPFDEVNLRAMTRMMKEFSLPVGYSDHTLGAQTAVMAAALGAALYECHFTLDKKLSGPDHVASADPQELKEKITAIRRAETILGSAKKEPAKSELIMRKTMRKSIIFTRALKRGAILTRKDLGAKRPGDGISPVKFMEFLGKKLTHSVQVDQKLSPRDII